MDASKFIARLATIYQVQNNAFIVPVEDAAGRLVGYYPVLPQQTSIREYGGVPYLQYEFWGGQRAAVELSRAGLLTQHQYEDDFFGADNRPMLPTLQVMHTQDEGIVNGIKNATTIRFLARLAANLKQKDIDAERKRFAKDNLEGNSTGVMMFDSKYADVKQIESTALVVNPRQQELIRESVFEYFGTNEKLLTNTYTEDEWNAYYEGCIEPFAIQLSLVLTAMTFTPDEIAQGAGIIATANRLQYASNNTKLNIVTQLFDRGFLERTTWALRYSICRRSRAATSITSARSMRKYPTCPSWTRWNPSQPDQRRATMAITPETRDYRTFEVRARWRTAATGRDSAA